MTNTKNINLSKIIKRLQLIKSLIALEEDEELAPHIEKLQQETTTPAIENIITLLQQTQYGKAIAAIDEFINANNQLTFYIDPEIEALRFEAKGLEKQIQELSNEKAELDKLIHEFSVRHNQELGELILKILSYRKQQYKDHTTTRGNRKRLRRILQRLPNYQRRKSSHTKRRRTKRDKRKIQKGK